MHGKLVDWFYSVKWFFQRLFRGYSDGDMLDFGPFLCRKILPKLKKWVNKEHWGYPADFSSFDEWKAILDKIVWAVEETAYNKEETSIIEDWEKDKDNELMRSRIEENWERTKEGMILFGKYIGAMWD